MGRFFHLYLTTGLITLGLNYAWVGGVGVLPVLQMMILPVASYWLADRWITRRAGQSETS